MADKFGDKKNTNGFDKNPQNINRTGENRKVISSINKELKEKGFEKATKQDVIDAYLTMVNLPYSIISDIANKNIDDYPIFYKLVAKEMLGKRGMEMLEKLLDRSIGKSNQSIELSGNVTTTYDKDMAEKLLNMCYNPDTKKFEKL